jgi:hypothetical protein
MNCLPNFGNEDGLPWKNLVGWVAALFAEKMPAYGGRYAHLTWDIPATEFRVGKDA